MTPAVHGVQGKEVWLLKIKGIDTPEAADNLKGQVLAMPAQERPQLNSDDEFYAQELIGMQVWLIFARDSC